MNLDTLIEILNDYREEFGGDAEVRLMTQQNWPFENRICGVTSGRDMNDASDDEDEGDVVPVTAKPGQLLEDGSEPSPEGRTAEGTVEHTDESDADLNGGEESAGVFGESERATGAAATGFRQLLQSHPA